MLHQNGIEVTLRTACLLILCSRVSRKLSARGGMLKNMFANSSRLNEERARKTHRRVKSLMLPVALLLWSEPL